jgi:hypothetical protein
MKSAMRAALVALPLLFGAAQGHAATIFSDNFNTENGGVADASTLNYNTFANWTVNGGGTVDLIGNGYFDFYPGQGLYVDLDGSTSNAGQLTSINIALNPGTYTLQFLLGGSQRGDTNTVRVWLGSLYSESFTLASSDPLALVTRTVTVLGATRVSTSRTRGATMSA